MAFRAAIVLRYSTAATAGSCPGRFLLCYATELALTGIGHFNALQVLGYTSVTLFEEFKKKKDHPRERLLETISRPLRGCNRKIKRHCKGAPKHKKAVIILNRAYSLCAQADRSRRPRSADPRAQRLRTITCPGRPPSRPAGRCPPSPLPSSRRGRSSARGSRAR